MFPNFIDSRPILSGERLARMSVRLEVMLTHGVPNQPRATWEHGDIQTTAQADQVNVRTFEKIFKMLKLEIRRRFYF
jgi:hypothetical protein